MPVIRPKGQIGKTNCICQHLVNMCLIFMARWISKEASCVGNYITATMEMMVLWYFFKIWNQLFIPRRVVLCHTACDRVHLFWHLHCKLKQIRWEIEKAIEKHPPFRPTESWIILLDWYMAANLSLLVIIDASNSLFMICNRKHKYCDPTSKKSRKTAFMRWDYCRRTQIVEI